MKKNSLKTYICLLLAIVMIVSTWGCSAEPVQPSDDAQQNGDVTEPDNSGTTAPDNGGTTEPDNGDANEPDNGKTEDEPVVETAKWTIANLKSAKIVYPGKTYAAGGQVETALDSLITAIKSRFSCELVKTIDQVLPNHATYTEYE